MIPGIDEAFDQMDSADRLLFGSAYEVARSAFWQHLLEQLDQQMMQWNGEMLVKLMEGDEKKALIAGARIQAYEWMLRYLNAMIEEILQQSKDQGQEELYEQD
jgi:hypothetical protein